MRIIGCVKDVSLFDYNVLRNTACYVVQRRFQITRSLHLVQSAFYKFYVNIQRLILSVSTTLTFFYSL